MATADPLTIITADRTDDCRLTTDDRRLTTTTDD
jgi:hypothetical protein